MPGSDIGAYSAACVPSITGHVLLLAEGRPEHWLMPTVGARRRFGCCSPTACIFRAP
jgi:hypothetical protein